MKSTPAPRQVELRDATLGVGRRVEIARYPEAGRELGDLGGQESQAGHGIEDSRFGLLAPVAAKEVAVRVIEADEADVRVTVYGE